MPKVRTLRYLLDLLKEVDRRTELIDNKQADLRRLIYPAVPEDGWKGAQKRYTLSGTLEAPSRYHAEQKLCVLRLGYSSYNERICDSWSIEWYDGHMDANLLRSYAKIDVSKAPTGPMESLAYEGTLLGWVERWEQVLSHTPESTDFIRRYIELDERQRDLRRRYGTIYTAIQHIVMAARPKDRDRIRSDTGSRYRYVLPDGQTFSSDGESFHMSDFARTIPIDYDLKQAVVSDPYGWDKHDGSNRALKQKRKEKKDGKPTY
jgi:hypothetical protein